MNNMDMYYRIIPCSSKKNKPYVWEKSNVLDHKLKEQDFCKSMLIDEKEATDIKIYSVDKYSSEDLDDVLQGIMVYLPIISKNVLNLVDTLNCSIQTFPVSVYSKNKLLSTDYFIVNTLREVDALDIKNSYYTTMGQILPSFCKSEEDKSKIFTIINPVLFAEKLNDSDIFRVKYDKNHMYVSGKFKNGFEKNNFSGWEFEKIEINQ